jgi:hypothetical protein
VLKVKLKSVLTRDWPVVSRDTWEPAVAIGSDSMQYSEAPIEINIIKPQSWK